MRARSTKVRFCKHCGCKIGPPSGQRRKPAHYGSLETCARLRKAVWELETARSLLQLYRIKFAVSDVGGWDGGAHLAAKDALEALGEPGIGFNEAIKMAREISE